jgi:hypothetical protein
MRFALHLPEAPLGTPYRADKWHPHRLLSVVVGETSEVWSTFVDICAVLSIEALDGQANGVAFRMGAEENPNSSPFSLVCIHVICIVRANESL